MTTKRGNPKWKKGISGNPAGRPRDGESWAAIIKAVGDMYPSDIIAFIGANNDLGRALKQLPQNVQMKYLVTARVFASLMFEPSHGLWKELMERAEGKVRENVDLTSGGEKIVPVVTDEVINRAISTLTDALGEIISGKSDQPKGKVDTAK